MAGMLITLYHLPCKMRTYILWSIVCCLCLISCESKKELPKLRFESSQGLETATYKEVIEFYKALDQRYSTVAFRTVGETDSGIPLSIVIFNPSGDFSLAEDQPKLLINNGIHPGESDGIDASMILMRELAEGSLRTTATVVVIPVYNIGGALNRNSFTRANQNGPLEYGFRGNARNFDLNRDFIKADSKNARSFAEIFHMTEPDLFIDNHVSNGADYQYVITHLFTQHNKLGSINGEFLHHKWHPYLEQQMQAVSFPITPYVNVFGRTPDTGFSQFMDYPRYSTGYTSLFNTLGMMVETHMLKPYQERVHATLALLKVNLAFLESNYTEIKQNKADSEKELYEAGSYPLNYDLNRNKYQSILFKGYEGETVTSAVTGLPRLQYDQNKPFEKEVPYFNQFDATNFIAIPEAYIIPQGQWEVIQRLKENGITPTKILKESRVEVEVQHIQEYQTRSNAYEGHYPHYATSTRSSLEQVVVYPGDYRIETTPKNFRYLMETLEPSAVDSFFNWNYFDAILQQKEGFSGYVFEDYALKFLKKNPEIASEFEEKKANDSNFSKDSYAQLDWIFKRTSLYEKNHLRYPIYKVLKKQ